MPVAFLLGPVSQLMPITKLDQQPSKFLDHTHFEKAFWLSSLMVAIFLAVSFATCAVVMAVTAGALLGGTNKGPKPLFDEMEMAMMLSR